jgi:hypothetical protein
VPGLLYVYALGIDSGIWRNRWEGGSWSGWELLGTGLLSLPRYDGAVLRSSFLQGTRWVRSGPPSMVPGGRLLTSAGGRQGLGYLEHAANPFASTPPNLRGLGLHNPLPPQSTTSGTLWGSWKMTLRDIALHDVILSSCCDWPRPRIALIRT